MKHILILVALISALPAQTIAGAWATRTDLEAAAPGDTPQPDDPLDISYPCGFSGNCDLEDFLKRLDVCALFVMHAGKPVLHKFAPDRKGCEDKVARERYGIASITKSITSLVLGGIIEQDPSLTVEMSARDALAPSGVRYATRRTSLLSIVGLAILKGIDESIAFGQ